MELHSRNSKTIVLIYTLIFHSLKSLFIIIENRVMLIVVPWGMPPWVCLHSDKVLSIHTAWVSISQKRLSNQIEQGPHRGVRIRPQVYGDLSYQIPLKSLKRRFRHRNFSNHQPRGQLVKDKQGHGLLTVLFWQIACGQYTRLLGVQISHW